MVGAEYAAVRDSWPQLRQPRPVLRRGRILPGPLKSLDRRGRRPVWALSVGVVGLSLIATWAIAAQIRSNPADVAPVIAAPVVEALPDVAPPVRIVGAAQAPQLSPVSERAAAIEPAPPAAELDEAPPPRAASGGVAPIPAPKPVAALPADLGALPVLELDETTFDAMQAPSSESLSRAVTRASARP